MRSKQYDILLVDDDAEDRMMLGEAFAELSCMDRVTMYDSGFSFHRDLEYLKTLSPLPYLVVLDYNMPGADGSVLLSLLKNDMVLRTIPVILYSTGLSRTQERDCLSIGAAGCFQKGATYNEMLTFVNELCSEAFRQRPVL